MKFKTKDEVHNKALKIEGIKQKDLKKQLGIKIKGDKNAMGDIFESWFGKVKDSASKPDLDVSELKATPFKILKNGKVSAKERLVLNIINYVELDKENFFNSHFMNKNKVIEMAFYEYKRNVNKDEWFFNKCVTYEMEKDKNDLEIIKNDWKKIQSFIRKGKAEDLSERETNYLAACTKGKNKKSLRIQPNSKEMAKQRAFSFKTSFMTTLLRNYIFGNKKSDAIVKDASELENKSLEEIIYNKFSKYLNKTTKELIDILNIPKKNSNTIGKYNVQIVNKILGIRGKQKTNADEFEKASIVPKTIQFDSKKRNKESMSLPPFKFKDLINEKWIDEDGNPSATLNVYLSESKFLFVVFQMDSNGNNYLRGIKFFKMPSKDLNGKVKDAWKNTIQTINNGVKLEFINQSKNGIVHNNFIGAKSQKIIHVRPHTANRSYVKSENSNELPIKAQWTNKPKDFSNYFMTTQSFWLNSNYIKNATKNLLE
ncbi:Sau3AI family type II restriction endonuclease [Apilactobacillus timberlakei]|nr:Sau3AI family type II restriction endonuclease [Apilactobacillus timberlakei]